MAGNALPSQRSEPDAVNGGVGQREGIAVTATMSRNDQPRTEPLFKLREAVTRRRAYNRD